MKEDLHFFLKVCRNAFILGALYFCSVWASTNELSFLVHIKPVLIFIIGYVGAELVARYKIQEPPQLIKTLIL